MRKVLLMLIAVPFLVFGGGENTTKKEITRGKVERIEVKSSTKVVVVIKTSDEGKIMELTFGNNFIKNGKKLKDTNSICRGDDIAIVKTTSTSIKREKLPGNPATPKFEEKEVTTTSTTVYVGEDALKVK